MASKKNKARAARDANPRKFKKKTSILVIEKTEYIDYKDVDLLRRFMSDRSKIKNRRVAGNTLQQQREVAAAIKLAREMALLPYATRVASTRTGGRRDRDGGRDGGREGGRDRDESQTDGDNEETTNDDAVDQVDGGTSDGAVEEAAGTDAAESTEAEA
jgi:small subunit ribosomal protein S18